MAIGELLVAKGIITEAQLKAVLQQQKIAAESIVELRTFIDTAADPSRSEEHTSELQSPS